jgi:hypothetical protein
MFDLRHRLEFIINSDISGNNFKLGFNVLITNIRLIRLYCKQINKFAEHPLYFTTSRAWFRT